MITKFLSHVPGLLAHGLLTIATLALVACGGGIKTMVPLETPRRLVTTSDTALMVFVRPSSMAWAIAPAIVNDEGRFVCHIRVRALCAVRVYPGHHQFYAIGENTEALSADVVAGRVYYAKVGMRMGALSARVHFSGMHPTDEDWASREQWRTELRQMVPLLGVGDQELARQNEMVQERIRRGRERLTRYEGAEIAEHTLGPEDGQ